MVGPGQSAVFVLANTSDSATIAERFRGYGGTMLRTTLPDEQARKLQKTLAMQAEPVIRWGAEQPPFGESCGASWQIPRRMAGISCHADPKECDV
jgi:hypothetical protein